MAPQPAQLQITIGANAVHVVRGTHDRFWSGYEKGFWEPATRAIFKRFIDPRYSYIDMGAWIGPTLLIGCQLAKRCHGIEPDPIAYAELVENMAANRPLTNNVQLFNICIAPVSGEIAFGSQAEGGDSMSSLLFANGKTSWTVEGVNFQEWIEHNGIDDCNFIKIDIEGGEYRVLPTMTAYLRKHRPTLYLSLHPCFLGELQIEGLTAKLERSVLRLMNTVRILQMLRFYRHWYDPFRTAPSLAASSLRYRTHHVLAIKSWKLFVLLLTCLNGVLGRLSALVLTDQEWDVPA
jgi:FkbM family methyltransferase